MRNGKRLAPPESLARLCACVEEELRGGLPDRLCPAQESSIVSGRNLATTAGRAAEADELVAAMQNKTPNLAPSGPLGKLQWS